MRSETRQQKKKENGDTAKKIMRLLRPYMHYLILSLIFAVVSVVLTLYAPILTGEAVDKIIGAGQVDFAGILAILKKLTVVILITSLSQWLMNLCNNTITYRVVKDVRVKAFAKLQELPLKYIDSHQYGETISRIITDVEQFSDGLLMGFSQLFTGVVTIAGTLAFMLSINVKISLVVILITPLSLFVAGFIAKRTYTMFKAQSEARAEMTSLVDEMVGNQKVVQAFGYGDRALERFSEINKKLGKVSLRATFFSSITNPSTRFVNGLVYAGVGITGAFAAIRGAITVGQLSCFLSYANQYTKPFNEISGVITELQNAAACARRVFEFIEEPPETPDAEEARVLGQADGSLELKNVSFSYKKESPLLQNLNLRVEPGQKIAIVGPTGCGKTTLINLLMRFYDIDSGQILISGHDLNEITRDSLRANFGMVLQETWLKQGTVAENIAYGHPDASREEIIEAAKAAHAHSFIRRMPQGYDTMIQEEGGNLSQGQKQLLCIARAMLKLPPMLILDEATSSIDVRTEIRVQKAFQRMMKGRTTFIVAHRLSTIQESDVILVMKDGNIIEQGNHQELLARGGFYKELYESQFAGNFS
jgi:ATP-binding cassette subfamily B protein